MIEYDRRAWRSHLFDIRGSLLKQIGARIAVAVAWSVVVYLAYPWFAAAGLPFPVVSTTLHTLIGAALGLLLVFRTNASYDRFWEGRKLWGGIVNETRNFARLAVAHLGNDRPLAESLVRRTIAWTHAAMHVLRGEQTLGLGATQLAASDAESLAKSDHPPLAIAISVTRDLVAARRGGTLTDKGLWLLDQNVQLLIDYLGGCERIHKTPLPYAYVVHLRRALILYVGTLPLAFVADAGAMSIFVVTLVAFVFFGIEEIGVEIEDPFEGDDNDLPLESICETIERNLTAVLAESAG